MRHAIYVLRNAGWYSLVPVVVVAALLPVGLFFLVTRGGASAASGYHRACTLLPIPALAAWWPGLIFRDRLEGDGRELLYLLHRRGQAVVLLALMCVYAVLILPFAAAGALLGVDPLLQGAVAAFARSLFVGTVGFCGAFLTSSSMFGLVAALGVNMLLMRPLEGLLAQWAIRMGDTSTGMGLPAVTLGFYAAAACVLLFIGELRSRVFTG